MYIIQNGDTIYLSTTVDGEVVAVIPDDEKMEHWLFNEGKWFFAKSLQDEKWRNSLSTELKIMIGKAEWDLLLYHYLAG